MSSRKARHLLGPSIRADTSPRRFGSKWPSSPEADKAQHAALQLERNLAPKQAHHRAHAIAWGVSALHLRVRRASSRRPCSSSATASLKNRTNACLCTRTNASTYSWGDALSNVRPDFRAISTYVCWTSAAECQPRLAYARPKSPQTDCYGPACAQRGPQSRHDLAEAAANMGDARPTCASSSRTSARQAEDAQTSDNRRVPAIQHRCMHTVFPPKRQAPADFPSHHRRDLRALPHNNEPAHKSARRKHPTRRRNRRIGDPPSARLEGPSV